MNIRRDEIQNLLLTDSSSLVLKERKVLTANVLSMHVSLCLSLDKVAIAPQARHPSILDIATLPPEIALDRVRGEYFLISFRKSTPPQNRQFDILISSS